MSFLRFKNIAMGRGGKKATADNSDRKDEEAITTKESHTTMNKKEINDNNSTCFTMPAEDDLPHEGTWLQWPHNYGWDKYHIKRYEQSWIEMVFALYKEENVHIIAYNEEERKRIETVLNEKYQQQMNDINSQEEEEVNNAVDKHNILNSGTIDFYVFPTNDVWIRDNGPIFVLDSNNCLRITNWEFNGWGSKKKYIKYDLDNQIPKLVGAAIHVPVIDIPPVLEGGSIEIDGHGTLMAKRTSILNKNRNPGYTQEDIEEYFSKYLGVTNFIWLQGKCTKQDITDDHIDGTARFANNGTTIVTFYRDEFMVKKDYDIISQATNAHGKKYRIVHLPLTKHKIKKVGDYGIYTNYYVGNKVVIVPKFNDPNDDIVAGIIKKEVYPSHTVVQIDFNEVYKDGGLVHCVTQQQPKGGVL